MKLPFWISLWVVLSFSLSAVAQTGVCVVTLEGDIDVTPYPQAAAPITLPVGTPLELVGRTSDGTNVIVRTDTGYALHPSVGLLRVPNGCTLSAWGAPPPDYVPLATVLDATRIHTWQSGGHRGAGVRVGVLDARFDGLDQFLAGNSQLQVILTQSMAILTAELDEANNTEAYHGTNVLEVVSSIATESTFIVARAVNAEQFTRAVDLLIGQGAQIIVHSGNVITPDPQPYHTAVQRAIDAGVLWINSAGNVGAGYYPGAFSGGGRRLPAHQFDDPNRSGVQLDLMVAVDPNRNAGVTLLWDGANPADFALDVAGNCRFDEQYGFLEGADADQTQPGAQPVERLRLSSGLLRQIADYAAVPSAGELANCEPDANPDGMRDNEVYISITDVGGNARADTPFELYVEGALPAAYDPDIQVSLDPVVLVPGDLPGVLTVGAFDPHSNRMAWYSGRSNSLQYYQLNDFDIDYTTDERVKPEIVSYGEIRLPSERDFFGTSAAAPVVGGAAALIAGGLAEFDADVVRDLVIHGSVTCLDADGAVGRGIGRLALSSVPGETMRTTCDNYDWLPDLSSLRVENFTAPAVTQLENEARAGELAIRSRELVSTRYDLALHLALEAVRVSPSLESRTNLFAVLQNNNHIAGIIPVGAFVTQDILMAQAISPDGRYFARGFCQDYYDCPEGYILLMELASGDVQTLGGYIGGGLRFTDDNAILVGFFGGNPGTEGIRNRLTRWNVGTGAEIDHRQLPLTDYGGAWYLTTNGKYLIVDDQYEAVRVYDMNGAELITIPRSGAFPISDIDYSEEANVLVFSNYFEVEVWALPQAEQIATLGGHDWRVSALAVSDDGRYVVSGDERGGIVTRSVNDPDNFERVDACIINEACTSPWVDNLAFVGNLYNFISYGNSQLTLRDSLGQRVRALNGQFIDVLGDGETLAAWATDHIVLYDTLETGALYHLVVQQPSEDLEALMEYRGEGMLYESPDWAVQMDIGDTESGYELRFFDPATENQIYTPIRGSGARPVIAEVKHDGTQVVTLTEANSGVDLNVYSIPTGELLHSEHVRVELGLAALGEFSWNDAYFVLGAQSTVHVWETSGWVRQLDRTVTVSDVNSSVEDVIFSPDNRLLVVASSARGINDFISLRSVELIDVVEGESIGRYFNDYSRASDFFLDMTADGRFVQVMDSDLNLWLGDLSLAQWAARACEIAPRNMTEEEWAANVPELPYQQTCPATWIDD